jgi:hypothetical protein
LLLREEVQGLPIAGVQRGRNPGRLDGAAGCVSDEPFPTALVPRRFASQLRPDRLCSPWRDRGT